MSEYIIELPDSGADDEFVAKMGVEDCRIYGYRLTGEIVRCRDCKHFKHGFACEENGCTYCGEPLRTEPDGFCKWGERRGNEQTV